ncbi:hypothetical protein D0Z03_000638 [Geotrichum reessii]|nr:hypothetical protein D0Z03_000638 [Galactomyces reessii]
MRLIRSKWVDEYDPTIEDSYSTNRVVDGKNYRLDIIDTAGQEEYRDMLGSLFSSDNTIDGYLLVYDITSRTSLENLEYFDELIEKNIDLRPDNTIKPIKIVAGNKCDLSENRVISSTEGLNWAKAHGCGFMETSAKVMVNIEETFEILIRQVVNQRRTQLESKSVKTNVTATSLPNNTSFNSNADTSLRNQPLEKPSDDTSKKRNGCCIIC